MAWLEIVTAEKESKHEIILTGNEISERINTNGLDLTLFNLVALNYLNIHETSLSCVPDELAKLTNLQTLVLHSNKIEKVTPKIGQLLKLKVLDLSHNCLKTIPDEISELLQLNTLNISHNQLETLPTLSKNVKLTVLDVSCNKLQSFPDICYAEISISEIHLSCNQIEIIPEKISSLSSLKVFYLNSNNVKEICGELSDCNKLKDLNLKDNPLNDKRLTKLVLQCHTKQVLDYIKLHCKRSCPIDGKATKKGKKNANKSDNSKINKSPDYNYKIIVQHFTNDSIKVVVKDDVKDVRPHLVACLVLNLQFNEDRLKKFIQLQTKLHDTICEKRNAATIATHDLKKLNNGDLIYTAVSPKELLIKPLNRQQNMTGAQLFSRLQLEAENLRKEKKRNVYSGVHKYLYLLEGKPKYPCLVNAAEDVISFPPITNSDISKMSLDTASLLIEVTGTTSIGLCKKIADNLLKEMLPIFGEELVVQQVKNVDIDGNLKSVYPSRSDLIFDPNCGILIERA